MPNFDIRYEFIDPSIAVNILAVLIIANFCSPNYMHIIAVPSIVTYFVYLVFTPLHAYICRLKNINIFTVPSSCTCLQS